MQDPEDVQTIPNFGFFKNTVVLQGENGAEPWLEKDCDGGGRPAATSSPSYQRGRQTYSPLTPIQKVQDVFVPPEGGVVALIIETDQDVQQGLHTHTLTIGLSWTVQDQLLQLLQTHLPRHDYCCWALKRWWRQSEGLKQQNTSKARGEEGPHLEDVSKISSLCC